MGGAEEGLSGLTGPSGGAVTSPGEVAGEVRGDAAALRRGEAGALERVGLTAGAGGGAGLVGEVGVVLRCDDDDDDDDEEGVPGQCRAPGVTEKVVGVLRPNLTSNSLHTAKLRLTPSDPADTPKPEPPTASEPFASSWQRSTKLPLRTDPHSLSGCLWGRGLEDRLWG